MSDYVPTTETSLKAFVLNFDGQVSPTPEAFGLGASDATALQAAVQDFVAKLELARNPLTRSMAHIIDKDNAKAAMIPVLRNCAMRIKLNPALSDSVKAGLGLKLSDPPTPVPTPSTHPLINIVGLATRQHQLRFSDVLTPESGIRPRGVTGLQLFCHVGDAPPAAGTLPPFRELVTKMSIRLDFNETEVGKTAYYYGRWQTRGGRVGPMSPMVSKTIAG